MVYSGAPGHSCPRERLRAWRVETRVGGAPPRRRRRRGLLLPPLRKGGKRSAALPCARADTEFTLIVVQDPTPPGEV